MSQSSQHKLVKRKPTSKEKNKANSKAKNMWKLALSAAVLLLGVAAEGGFKCDVARDYAAISNMVSYSFKLADDMDGGDSSLGEKFCEMFTDNGVYARRDGSLNLGSKAEICAKVQDFNSCGCDYHATVGVLTLMCIEGAMDDYYMAYSTVSEVWFEDDPVPSPSHGKGKGKGAVDKHSESKQILNPAKYYFTLVSDGAGGFKYSEYTWDNMVTGF